MKRWTKVNAIRTMKVFKKNVQVGPKDLTEKDMEGKGEIDE